MAGIVPLPALPYGATPGNTYVVLRREAGRCRGREGREGGRERGVYTCFVSQLFQPATHLPARPPSLPPSLDTVITPESLECQLLFNVVDVDPVSGEVRREGGREGRRRRSKDGVLLYVSI